MRTVGRVRHSEKRGGNGGLPVVLTALQDTSTRADYLERERRSRPEGWDEPTLPLTPAAGWGIALLTSVRSGGAFGRRSPRWFPPRANRHRTPARELRYADPIGAHCAIVICQTSARQNLL